MSNRTTVNKLAATFLEKNNPTGWFEELYAGANGDAGSIPWANLTVNPHLADWLTRNQLEGKENKALVVGCGLGDDAEALSNMGYRVTGFDISPSAIAWCQQRFRDSSVEYLVSDALQLETSWENSFDLIVEAYTLQALPQSVRQQIMSNLVNYLAPGGMLLVIWCDSFSTKPVQSTGWY